MEGKRYQMFGMPKLRRPVVLGIALALVVLLGAGAFAARQVANAAEPLEGNRVAASDVRILVRAASSCPALTPARLAGQVMVASNFRDEPVAEMRKGGATGVAALTPEQWQRYAPWTGADPSDREAGITALAHGMCQLVGQSRALKIDEDPWRVALAAHRLGMDQVIAAGAVPSGARDYVDAVDRYASWYALQPAFGGVPAAPASTGPAVGGAVVPVPEPYVAAVTAAGKVCPEMPPDRIAAQIMATSGFDPDKLGPAGEQGIAQFLPRVWTTTGKSAAKRTPWDPSVAIPALGRTMCKLVEKSGGQYPAALAAFTGDRERATPLAEIVAKTQAEYAKDTRLQAPRALPVDKPAASATPTPDPAAGTKAPQGDQPPVKAVAGDGPGNSYGPYFIYNLRYKVCVDVPNFGPGRSEGPVGQFECARNRDDNQQWTFEPRGVDSSGGYQLYWIRNIDDRLCIDLPGSGKVEANTAVQQYECRDHDNQYFRLEPKRDSGGLQYYWLRATKSGMCLDIPSQGNADPKAPLTLFPCSSGDDHEWALVKKFD
ncbi:RICIN domain-containing protein [Micromonospora sp. NPDC049051]|uniref:RICIN domain-containing protein n=1 Tax=Micromonospora sp. NPDC049051 TaxID=3364264 RepID=UPI003722FE89